MLYKNIFRFLKGSPLSFLYFWPWRVSFYNKKNVVYRVMKTSNSNELNWNTLKPLKPSQGTLGKSEWTDKGCIVIRINLKSIECRCNTPNANFAVLSELYFPPGGETEFEQSDLALGKFFDTRACGPRHSTPKNLH